MLEDRFLKSRLDHGVEAMYHVRHIILDHTAFNGAIESSRNWECPALCKPADQGLGLGLG